MRTTEQKPAPIEEEISRGLMMLLAECFGLTEGEDLFYAPSTTKAIQAQQQKLQKAGKALSFPMMYVKLTTANRAVQNTGYNPKSLARHGIYVTTDHKDRKFARKLHPFRVDMDFEIVFLVDDQKKAMAFVSSWMTLGQENRLNFTVTYYGIGVDIAVRLADSITVPEKETSVDEALNVYEFSASLSVEGYMTAQHVDNDSLIPLVEKISLGTTPIEPGSSGDLANPRVLNQALAYRSNK